MNFNQLFEQSERLTSGNPQELLYDKQSRTQDTIKCRICYETKKPLVSVCACSGSIQYVHEDCILDWIGKKVQTADTLEIPNCQICHQKFSAKLKISKQRLSYGMLFNKFRFSSKKEFFGIIFHFFMVIVCIFMIVAAVPTIYNKHWNQNSQAMDIQPRQNNILEIIKFLFTNIVIQIYGILYFCNFLSSKRKWLKQCMVHVVQVLLLPKIIYK